MTIEEAEDVLNEAVIDYPSITSYNYISAEEINTAIEKVLEEKLKEEIMVRTLKEEINNYRNIINEKEREIEELKIRKYKNIYIKLLTKYIKKVVKPLFLLEN